MAIGALIPLILGGGLALKERKKRLAETNRQGLASAFGEQIGNVGSPGQQATLFNDQSQPIGDLSGVGAMQGSGLLGQTNDPVLQQQLQAARNIFGTAGGEQLGASMLQTALASQQAQRQQANQFAQQGQQQEKSFAQQDQQQENQFKNSNAQAQASLQQSDLHHQERIAETRRLRQDDIAREAAAFAQSNSIAGIARPGYNRIQDPNGAAGSWVEIPDATNPLYIEAAGKVDGLAGQIERMDSMMSLFDDVGTNAFGEKGGELQSSYTSAKLNMKNVFELGVLSADDERLLSEVMQDPNGFHAATTGDKTIRAGYENAMQILQRALRTENQKYQYWGIGSNLDKTTPTQQREIELQQRQAETAAAQGLILGDAPAQVQQPANRRQRGGGAAAASSAGAPTGGTFGRRRGAGA